MSKIINSYTLTVNKLDVQVEIKKINTIRLRIYPPDGAVKISAPVSIAEKVIRDFISSRITWITKQQQKMKKCEDYSSLKLTDGEEIMLWGKPCKLMTIEKPGRPYAEFKQNILTLHLRPGSDFDKRNRLFQSLLKEELNPRFSSLAEKWSKILGVKANILKIQKMKSRWGSCNIRSKTIKVNLELVKLNPVCLEYIVVHELVHLIERYHNKRFYAIIDSHFPHRKKVDALLSKITLR